MGEEKDVFGGEKRCVGGEGVDGGRRKRCWGREEVCRWGRR